VRAKVKDSDIASLIVAGKNNSEIARALHVDRKRVAKVRELAASTSTSLSPHSGGTSLDTVRAIVRLEMSQEEAINEYSDQLAEYTRNYRAAIRLGDQEAATRWASLRLKLLEMMVRISGLEKRAPVSAPSSQEVLSQMTDEEVERRAREILAKRQR